LSNGSSIIEQWTLHNYTTSRESSAPNVNILSVSKYEQPVLISFSGQGFEYLNNVRGTLTKINDNGALWQYEDDKVLIQRKISDQLDHYYFDLGLSVKFKTPQKAERI